MIQCTECGSRNGDSDAFCGACGRFLEWSGEKVAVAKPKVVEVAVPVARKRPTLYQRVMGAVMGGVSTDDGDFYDTGQESSVATRGKADNMTPPPTPAAAPGPPGP
ncbi:zinc ribbon domain-containing protein, partial [Actinokineospora bangkokensis]|uniref:zinc ribbon domain-containing protein n=1 Tax=Actinokineospora bangkokensis TaxID=1193682 RepID=UPI000AEAEDC9